MIYNCRSVELGECAEQRGNMKINTVRSLSVLNGTIAGYFASTRLFRTMQVLFAVLAITLLSTDAGAASGADTWVGNTSVNWADGNWSGTNNPPISGDSLIFGAAGSSGLALNKLAG